MQSCLPRFSSSCRFFAAAALIAAHACFADVAWSPADRAALAELRAAGKQHATVLLLVPPTDIADARRAAAASGEVQKELTQIGYLRVRAPMDRLDALLALPGVEHAAISKAQLFEVQGAPARTPPPPAVSLPDDNPFTSLDTLGVLDFAARHPTFDGRGVTIGAIDSGFDPASASLGIALDLQGAPVAKLIDWSSSNAGAEDVTALSTSFYGYHLDPPTALRVPVEPVTMRGGRIAFQDRLYTPPAGVLHRNLGIGLFDGTRLNTFTGGTDLDRDGRINRESDTFAVLLDRRSGRVWIDLRHDGDFSHAMPLRDFSIAREWGELGVDDPATPLRESAAFVLHVDAAAGEVRFDLAALADHGMMVAGIAAGGRYLDGPRIGIAQHAALIMNTMRVAYTHSYVELAARVFTDPRSDLVTWSGGDLLRPSDGSSFLDAAIRRIVRLDRKPIVMAAGNSGPFIGQTMSPSVIDDVLSVGGYIPRGAVAAFKGYAPLAQHTIAPYSAAGPTDDGRVKPDVLGITETLSLAPSMLRGRSGLREGSGPFELSAGYAISGGTSAAAPSVAGVVALLISGAKQERVAYDRARLKSALISSARFLDGVEAWRQGNGLVQAPQAWEMLKRIPTNWSPVQIDSFAPVRTQFAHRLAAANVGRGIFEREGWEQGAVATRTIRFIRRSGPAGPVTYRVRWKGDTSSFSAAATELRLPLGVEVAMPVRIAPTRHGVNAAILDLIEPGTDLIAYQVMNTVIVPEKLAASAGYRSRVSGTVPRPGVESIFLDVPADTRVLRLRCELADAYASLRVARPDGSPFSTRGSAASFLPQQWIRDGVFELSIPYPDAGVWQVAIRNSGDSDEGYDPATQDGVKPASFALEALALRAEAVGPASSRVSASEPATALSSRLLTATFVNRYAAQQTAHVEGIGLGVQRHEAIRLTKQQRFRDFPIEIAAGTRQIEWSLGPQDPTREEINLYLFDYTGQSPVLRGFAATPGPDRKLILRNPAPGKWILAVDGQRVAGNDTTVQLTRTTLHPAYGRLERTASSSPADGSFRADFAVIPRVAALPEEELIARVALVDEGVVGFVTRRDERGSNMDLAYKPYPAEKYLVPLGELTFELK